MSTKQTNAEKMQAGWGNSAPAWVQTLANACDAAGTRKTARKIGVSPACISWAVRNKRGYKFTFVQGKTESILMASIIPCPIKGAITRAECETEQARPFVATNRMRAQQFKACQQCKYREGK